MHQTYRRLIALTLCAGLITMAYSTQSEELWQVRIAHLPEFALTLCAGLITMAYSQKNSGR